MPPFAIIETDDGMTIMDLEPGVMPDDVAVKHGGVVVDPVVYKTYEDAYDAILAIQGEQEEDWQ